MIIHIKVRKKKDKALSSVCVQIYLVLKYFPYFSLFLNIKMAFLLFYDSDSK